MADKNSNTGGSNHLQELRASRQTLEHGTPPQSEAEIRAKFMKENKESDANAAGVVLAAFIIFCLVLAGIYMIRPHFPGLNFPGFVTNLKIAAGLSVGVLIIYWLFFSSEEKQLPDHKPAPVSAGRSSGRFGLWLGESTGWLSKLSHVAGMAPGQNVVLDISDACQNIVVLGATGSGKTTRAINPMLVQLLDQDAGGMIFDIKGDYKKDVLHFAKQAGRSVTVIGVGDGNKGINLLSGLTPEVAASFLKSIVLLAGGYGMEKFWVDTAAALCKNALGVLSFVPGYYSLEGLYLYLFNADKRVEIEKEISELPALKEKRKRLLDSYMAYHDQQFDKMEDKTKAGVLSTVSQFLEPFLHPELIDAFCSQSNDSVNMEDVLNGAVYLVDLPIHTWGLGGKVVYSLIKLRFYNVMQQRTSRPEWNHDRPVFFICDEFQEIVSASKDGLSDLNFWDKSRNSKTIGIISGQAVSSFYSAVGNRDVANTLLQNFRQKLCFKTEDTDTLNYFNNLAGRVEVKRVSYSDSTGQSHRNYGSSYDSHSESVSTVERPILDSQLFRSLHPEQAVALLSVGGHSMDDVINVKSVYV